MTAAPAGRAWTILPASRERFDGIRDFSAGLATALRGSLDIQIVTTREDAAPPAGARVVASWRELTGPAPDAIFVNYAPQAWLRFDARAVLAAMQQARAAGSRVALIIHEYQLDPRPSLKRRAARLVFDRLARRFARASTAIVTTHEFVADWARRDDLTQQARIVTIPVGSNLPDPAAGAAGLSSRSGLVMFGQPAGMDAALVRAGAAFAHRNGLPLTWVCRSHDEAEAWLRAADVARGAMQIAAAQPPERISHLLHSAAVGFAPIIDGVSTRRTTVSALLQHALPIAGSDGRATGPLYRDHPAFALAPIGDGARMARVLEDLLGDDDRRARMGSAARAIYDAELAWPRIADRYLQLLA